MCAKNIKVSRGKAKNQLFVKLIKNVRILDFFSEKRCQFNIVRMVHGKYDISRKEFRNICDFLEFFYCCYWWVPCLGYVRKKVDKLRKREEHSNSVHPVPDATTTVVLQTTTVAATVVTTNGTTPVATAGQPQRTEPNDPLAYRGQFLWAFPPPPAERILYNNEQKNIVQTTNNDRSGFVRGFRKNLGGRWRRLVKKKPTTEIYTIPAELKPQLKQIYVY
ncbi:uncharacterized protein LOC126734538 isoform X3 [Anthonomus grandis grandis]|uniref:uncharacterized protein LOC126734538 isoform X3 n=1 Tax=Anthonomus grandis grandis TaxID=2921223 RepID=UPI0021661406|nr:uncharacterized protein LOC126734538 isoform X3 [Anthonomus grandis grandis]